MSCGASRGPLPVQLSASLASSLWLVPAIPYVLYEVQVSSIYAPTSFVFHSWARSGLGWDTGHRGGIACSTTPSAPSRRVSPSLLCVDCVEAIGATRSGFVFPACAEVVPLRGLSFKFVEIKCRGREGLGSGRRFGLTPPHPSPTHSKRDLVFRGISGRGAVSTHTPWAMQVLRWCFCEQGPPNRTGG